MRMLSVVQLVILTTRTNSMWILFLQTWQNLAQEQLSRALSIASLQTEVVSCSQCCSLVSNITLALIKSDLSMPPDCNN